MKTILLVISLLFTQHALASGIYKYIDANGTVHYSAKKPKAASYELLGQQCYYNSTSCNAKSRPNWTREPLNHTSFATYIRSVADEYNLDEDLIRAVIHVESGFNPRAVSVKGAKGLMQLMPKTQAQYGVDRPFDYRENIAAGVKHLAYLLQRFNNNMHLAAAAYNAGETAVLKYKTIPPYKETRNYVRRVDFLFKRYKIARQSH